MTKQEQAKEQLKKQFDEEIISRIKHELNSQRNLRIQIAASQKLVAELEAAEFETYNLGLRSGTYVTLNQLS